MLLDGAPESGAALMELLLAGPTNARAGEPLPREKVPRSAATVRLSAAAASSVEALLARSVPARLAPGSAFEAADALGRPGPPIPSSSTARSSCPSIASAMSRSASSRRAATTSIRRRAITTPTSCRRTPTSPSISGCAKNFRADALIHMGKHGNLEWLPGKALALSENCFPEAALGPLPVIYPFIVNDPGEGAQAKRRSAAVVVDHLMPPMARAESYGAAAEIERLIDEYAAAEASDQRRAKCVAARDHRPCRAHGFSTATSASTSKATADGALAKLDAHICDLKELQIRDGLHVLGEGPAGRQRAETLVALARVPRGDGRDGDASLLRALAEDFGARLRSARLRLSSWTGRGDGPRLPGGGLRGGMIVRRSLAHMRRYAWSGWRRWLLRSGRQMALAPSHPALPARGGNPRGSRLRSQPKSRRLSTRSGAREIAAVLAALSGKFVAARPLRRADARSRRLPTDRSEFLLRRRSRRADAGRVGAWPALRRPPRRALFSGRGRVAAGDRADGLGHVEHAHRRRRHRPGAGADRRASGLGGRIGPRHRDRGHPACRA